MTPERWQQVERLYHAALEQAPAERAVFLDEACADDPDLRAEVDSLLAAAAGGDAFLEAPALEVTARALAAELPRLAVGQRLGAYQILAPLGAGGIGEVYTARDTRLERTVALKVLSPANAENAVWRQRFERESRALAALSHPHICQVFDVGRDGGVDFLVMEYLEGETLAARLAKGLIPFDQALRYGIEIADALAQAHRRGVLHRDLKPGNIMLTRSGVVLVDFGLARIELKASYSKDVDARAETLTSEGVIAGTLQYLSPEQLNGATADGRSDIFAFGAVLHEMLTGRRTFDGESHAMVIAAILEHAPLPVSSARPTAPAALDRAVSKALAKDPDERWQDAGDLRDELKWIAEDALGAGAKPAKDIAPRAAADRAVGLVRGDRSGAAGSFCDSLPATSREPAHAAAHFAREHRVVGQGGARHRHGSHRGDHARRHPGRVYRRQQPALRPPARSTRSDGDLIPAPLH